ncbi:related to nitrogen assimilation transcription factor nit-4 [Sporisorium reilianum f. sp. reilianum]|uniref:Related to nitrogen assimilation transcription factor nit-4 n=1 Tax=Sporisorium reilianum f. sp. reilianum TaxID=72559 RepID=A0A2N8UE53_9BASI|nr:related to nitrogen assimilation transcription factor nit-4 [Sporisorium reilianum f. sp. reilianum]
MRLYGPARKNALLVPARRVRPSDASSGPSPRRQPAVSTACDFCRRRKIRCNGEQPCDKCQQHGRAPTCHFQDRSSRQSSGNSAEPALHQARDRIRQLEDQLANVHRRSSSTSRENGALSPPSQSGAGARGAHRGSNGVGATSSYTLSDGSDDEVSFSHAPHVPSTTAARVSDARPAAPAATHHSHHSTPAPSSPTSSAVASIIADLGHPRHAVGHASSCTPSTASPGQHAPPRTVMSNLRVNNRGESRYHGPTSASFSAAEVLTADHRADGAVAPGGLRNDGASTTSNGGGVNANRQQHVSLDPALLTDRLTSLAARERQQEVMNVVAGKMDFDGVEPELAIHLLNLHWNRQHHAYLVTYRPLFMRDMAAPAGKAKYFSKLLFHAILFGAAKFSDRIDQVRSDVNDPSTAGLQFLERVQQLLPEALIKSRITTVQALLLLACTHYARGSESAAWLHSGLAFRMALDLGMNEDSIELVASGNMAIEELELRRRVVWAAFVIDKIHSLYQGRQASIERRNLYVPIEFHDHFEETEFWTPVAYHRPHSDAEGDAHNVALMPSGYTGPIYSVSTFAELCRLTVIMEKIIQVFYSIDSGTRTAQLIEMRRELAAWRTSLAAHLSIDSSLAAGGAQRSRTCPPNLISLHALYHALTILLNRPFLPHGHLRSDDATTGRSAWKACVDAASSISSLMNLYRQTVSMKGAPQLISYINFCAAGIHVRVAAQLQQGDAASSTAAASSRRYELKALRQCLQDFEENQDPNPGVVKAKSVIRNMAERAGILELLQDDGGGGQGGLSPMHQDDTPPLVHDSNNNEANALGANPPSMTATMPSVSTFTAGATSALNRTQTVDQSMLGVTPPYEIDFESILASFDQFESTSGGGVGGTSDANTNSDILFGFLRDYDAAPGSTLSM